MAWFISSERHFRNRFEPRGSGFAYRDDVRSPAVSVTAAEREQLVDDHLDKNGLSIIVAVVVVMLSIIIPALAGYLTHDGSWARSISLSALLIGMLILGRWSGSKRRRLLRGRPTLDEGLPRAEANRRELDDLSWSRLLYTGCFAAAWIYISVDVDRTTGTGERIVLLVSSALALASTIWQVIAKIRLNGRARRAT